MRQKWLITRNLQWHLTVKKTQLRLVPLTLAVWPPVVPPTYLSSWCSGTPGRAHGAEGRSPTGGACPARCWWPRSHTGSTGSPGCSGLPCPAPPRWRGSGWSPPSGARCCGEPLDTPWYCKQVSTNTQMQWGEPANTTASWLPQLFRVIAKPCFPSISYNLTAEALHSGRRPPGRKFHGIYVAPH